MSKKKKIFIVLTIILVTAQVANESVFKINPGEQIILTRFGEIEKGPIREPGYHFKFYRFDQVIRYPSKKTVVNLDFAGCPPRIPTYNISMSFIIVDPILFYKTIHRTESLQARLLYLLKDNYCSEKSDAIKDTTNSSISSFLNTELLEYGVAITKIDFEG